MKARWADVALGEVATVVRTSVSADAIQDGVLYVGLENIERGGAIRDVRSVSNGELQSTKFSFEPTDVLYGKLRPYLAKIARPAFSGICSTDILPVRPSAKLDADYLAYFLRQPGMVELASERAAGANLPRLSPAQLLRFRIPLPPLDEQRRIARILGIVSAAERRRSRSLSLIDDLLLGRFEQMFGNGSGAEWAHVPVRQFVSSFSGGKSFAGEDEDDQASPNRVLRVSAVTSGRFRPEQSRPVPRTYVPPADHHVRQGDLLISRANTSELVGAVALVESPIEGLLMPDKIWRFVWREQTAVVPEFIWQLFRTRAVRTALQRRSTGTSGSMKNISAEKLMGLEVIWPPAELQHEFGHFYKTMTPLRDQVRSHLAEIVALRASLGGSAFSGKI